MPLVAFCIEIFKNKELLRDSEKKLINSRVLHIKTKSGKEKAKRTDCSYTKAKTIKIDPLLMNITAINMLAFSASPWCKGQRCTQEMKLNLHYSFKTFY